MSQRKQLNAFAQHACHVIRGVHAMGRGATPTRLIHLLLFTSSFIAVAVASDPAELCPHGCTCDDQLDKLGCRTSVYCGGDLRGLPTSFPPNTTCISINSPALAHTSLPERQQFFHNLPSTLRLLDLSMSGLCSGEGLPEDAFANLSELAFLNLEYNSCRRLPRKLFHGLTTLRSLWLTGNHIEKDEEVYESAEPLSNKLAWLHADLFRDLRNLRVLLLHHNELATLPKGLFVGAPQLRVLKLADNRFPREMDASTPALASLVAGASLLCDPGVPSDGTCLQLDLHEDSGDELEDVWEHEGVTAASMEEYSVWEAKREGKSEL